MSNLVHSYFPYKEVSCLTRCMTQINNPTQKSAEPKLFTTGPNNPRKLSWILIPRINYPPERGPHGKTVNYNSEPRKTEDRKTYSITCQGNPMYPLKPHWGYYGIKARKRRGPGKTQVNRLSSLRFVSPSEKCLELDLGDPQVFTLHRERLF